MMPTNGTSTKLNADIDFTLRRVFGKTSFRPYQRAIITAALEGNDVFVQAGKSLLQRLGIRCHAKVWQQLPSGMVLP